MEKLKKEIKVWILIITLSLIIGITISNYYTFYIIKGNSMLNTLENNEYILIEKSNEKYFRKDIVLFKKKLKDRILKEQTLIKRIIAKPGDHLVIKNGEVYLNSNKLIEKYLKNNYTKGNIDMIIPENHYFVMGDNRKESLDSRNKKIGLVERNEIIGKLKYEIFK
ncbi:MAG: signal peptidase I [Bacillota bacterium]